MEPRSVRQSILNSTSLLDQFGEVCQRSTNATGCQTAPDIRLKKECAVDTLLETRAAIQTRLQEDLESKKSAAKVRLARVAGINSNAVLAGTPKSITIALPGESAANTTPAPSNLASPSFTNVPRYSWGT
jgi:hypothetical protein